MTACVRLARKLGVHLGAHPGPWNGADRGRGIVRLSGDAFELLLLQQVGALEKIARDHDVRLHHIKLHGALYHASEASPAIARRYVETAARCWPQTILYVSSGGLVARRARQLRVRVWEEVFADRGYRDDGTLVPRGERGALITTVSAVKERVRLLIERDQVQSLSGRRLHLRAQTICLHSDTPGAVKLAQTISRLLR
jgi:UPF0271 protein